jgi:YbbR domain-containing protein
MFAFLRNHLPLAVISLFLSTVLWLVVSGQNMTTHDVTATLELINIPKNMTVNQDIPEDINIRLEANTAQFKLMDGRKLNLKLNAEDIVPGPNLLNVDVSKLEPPLPRGIKVVRVIPEEIAFEVYPYVTKVLPVKPPVVGELPPYLERTGPDEIDPPVAKVTGPEQRVSSISEVSTVPIILSTIHNNENRVLLEPSLPGLDTWLTIEPREFKAHVPVIIKTGTQTFTVPIQLMGQPNIGPALPVSLNPREANVTVTWRMDRPQAPEANNVAIQVSLNSNELDRNQPTKIKLKAESVPGVIVTSIEPSEVEVVWLNNDNYERLTN